MSTPQPPRFRLDRRALTRAFERAGGGYDAAAVVQARVRTELLERLRFFSLTPATVLDLGAGTCHTALALRQRFRGARVIALDLAAGMLRHAPRGWWPRRRFARLCADAYALPLCAHSVDLIVSNLMLQWCDRPDAVFAEVQRVLRPGGLFVFSTFGPETLRELREAWMSADGGEHVSRFADMQELGDALTRARFAEPVMDVDQQHLHYADAHSLMRELQQIGATNAATDRGRGLTGRTRMRRMIEAYEQHRETRGLPATYEVIFGAAFGSDVAGESPMTHAGGEVLVPLQSLRRRGSGVHG